MTLKYGMKPFRKGSIRLKFANYIDRSNIPAVPKVFGHEYWPTGQWGMMGNDQAGDCVIAGAIHETMLYSHATGRGIPKFDDTSALANYSYCLKAAGGDPYNPDDPSTDTGLDPQQAAEWRRKTGLTDSSGQVHKIDAYAYVANVSDAMIGAFLFGACGLGLTLPESAATQFESGESWSDSSSPPANGHYVPLVGRNSAGLPVVVTWGALQAASTKYLTRYFAGGVVYLSREYMMANNVSPDLISWDLLEKDLASL